MPTIIWPEVLIAIVLVAILARLCSGARLFVSEESAHDEALERKRGRHRRNAHQSVLVLGSDDGEAPCKVISVSRRTIRIHSSRALPAESQLQVDRGDDCFVCGIRKVAAEASGYTLELNVLASNCHHRSITGLICARARQAVGLGLRRLAVRLGARPRPNDSENDE